MGIRQLFMLHRCWLILLKLTTAYPFVHTSPCRRHRWSITRLQAVLVAARIRWKLLVGTGIGTMLEQAAEDRSSDRSGVQSDRMAFGWRPAAQETSTPSSSPPRLAPTPPQHILLTCCLDSMSPGIVFQKSFVWHIAYDKNYVFGRFG